MGKFGRPVMAIETMGHAGVRGASSSASKRPMSRSFSAAGAYPKIGDPDEMPTDPIMPIDESMPTLAHVLRDLAVMMSVAIGLL